MVKIRIMGLPADVEAVTRELRHSFDVRQESTNYANRGNSDLVRRYLTLAEPTQENQTDGRKQHYPSNGR